MHRNFSTFRAVLSLMVAGVAGIAAYNIAAQKTKSSTETRSSKGVEEITVQAEGKEYCNTAVEGAMVAARKAIDAAKRQAVASDVN